jgi:hypothetical protein
MSNPFGTFFPVVEHLCDARLDPNGERCSEDHLTPIPGCGGAGFAFFAFVREALMNLAA